MSTEPESSDRASSASVDVERGNAWLGKGIFALSSLEREDKMHRISRRFADEDAICVLRKMERIQRLSQNLRKPMSRQAYEEMAMKLEMEMEAYKRYESLGIETDRRPKPKKMQRQKHLAHVRKTLEPEEANWAIDIDDYALRSRVETFELVAYYLVGRREWQWLLKPFKKAVEENETDLFSIVDEEAFIRFLTGSLYVSFVCVFLGVPLALRAVIEASPWVDLVVIFGLLAVFPFFLYVVMDEIQTVLIVTVAFAAVYFSLMGR